MAFPLKPCSNRMGGMHQGNDQATGLDLPKSCWMTLAPWQAIRYKVRVNRSTNGLSRKFLKILKKRWQNPQKPRRYGRRLPRWPVGIGFAGYALSKHRRPAKSISTLHSTNSTKA